MLSIGSYLSQLFAAICIFLGCMNTYFFVTNVPENTSLPGYFSGIATSMWPIGLGLLILLLMGIMHQLNFIRIAAQDRTYNVSPHNTPAPASAAIPFAKPAAYTPKPKPKEEETPVYFAINTPPPPPRPEKTPEPEPTPEDEPHEEQSADDPDSNNEPAETPAQTPEQEQLPERPKDPSLSFFKLD